MMPQKLDSGSLKIDFSSLNQVENLWCFCFVYPAAFSFFFSRCTARIYCVLKRNGGSSGNKN